MSVGVLTLRTALKRARDLGAEVAVVRRTGEVRVEADHSRGGLDGYRRLNLNNRRKDATPELQALLRDLEARAATRPRPATEPPPPGIIRINGEAQAHTPYVPPERVAPGPPRPLYTSKAEQIRAYLRNLPADLDGWHRFGSSQAVADGAGPGVTLQHASVALNWLAKSGKAELLKEGRYYSGIRFRDEPAPRALPRANGKPALTPYGLVPETPALEAYATARRIARDNPHLRVDLSPAELEAVLSEAARLWHWLRASGGDR